METMLIKTTPCPGNPEGLVVINCCDFNPEIHTPATAANVVTSTGDDPAREPGMATDQGAPASDGKPKDDQPADDGKGGKASKGKKNGKPKDDQPQ